jgi:hypothetical protein
MLKHRPGAIIKALLQLTPITVVVGLGSLWIGLSWELFIVHPRTIMMSCAMAFVYLVVRPPLHPWWGTMGASCDLPSRVYFADSSDRAAHLL